MSEEGWCVCPRYGYNQECTVHSMPQDTTKPKCVHCERHGCPGPKGYDYDCFGNPRRRDSMG